MTDTFVGSIEAGGTKFILGVQNVENGETTATKRVPTTTPAETLEACRDFFKENPVKAIEVSNFWLHFQDPKDWLVKY